MTPQRIGEVLGEQQRHDSPLPHEQLAWRHTAAQELLESLRRLGTLEEAPEFDELPPHPARPEVGEWIRGRHRYRSRHGARVIRDQSEGKAWHLFTWAQEVEPNGLDVGPPFALWTVCSRSVGIWDQNPARENRAYVERSPVLPDGACRRCVSGGPGWRAAEQLLREGIARS